MGFQSFVDEGGHYRMEVPEGWTHEDDLGDSFSTPNLDGVVVSVSLPPVQISPPPSPRHLVMESLMETLDLERSNIREAGPVEMAGYPAYFAHWNDDTTEVKIEAYRTLTNGPEVGRSYSLILRAPPAAFRDGFAAYSEMLASFVITD